VGGLADREPDEPAERADVARRRFPTAPRRVSVRTSNEQGGTAVDWSAIERSPEFRELVEGRKRFSWTAGAIGMGLGALYVVLAGVAPDLMGTQIIGSISLGYLGGVGLILLTWVITLMYMRRSDRVWGPLEEEIRRKAAASADGEADARFVKTGAGAESSAAPEVTR
jgi:uncharacterized membrane protein (DUF485 family)